MSDAALPAIGHLYQTVKRRLAPGSYAANQLAGLEEHPDRKGRQQAFASALAEMFQENAAFAGVRLIVVENRINLRVRVVRVQNRD